VIEHGEGEWNQDSVKDWIAAHMNDHISDWELMWELRYIETYDKTHSAFILRFHHTLGDGISGMSITSSLSDGIDLSTYGRSAFPIWKNVMLHCMIPFYGIREIV
jgi:hypothetical protein